VRNIQTKRTGLSKCKRALAHNPHIVSSLTVAAKCLHQICVAMLFVMHVSSPNNHVRTSSRTHAELYGLGCESGAEWAPGTSYGSGSSLQNSCRPAPPTVPAAPDLAALHLCRPCAVQPCAFAHYMLNPAPCYRTILEGNKGRGRDPSRGGLRLGWGIECAAPVGRCPNAAPIGLYPNPIACDECSGTGDSIGMYIDMDEGKMWFYRNQQPLDELPGT
jgi:hypothetical protein